MDPRNIPSIMRGAVDLSGLRERANATRTAQAQQPGQNRAAPGAGAAVANGADGTGGSGTAPGAPAAAPAAAGVPAGPSGSGGVTIIDVTEATFQSEVLERSLTTPVVIDFWADWCGPCKQLSPVLEKLAIEGNGVWVLAKVDVDANPRLAQAFRVQGIPMVYAVVGGQPVDAFTGVVPESQLRPWIEALLRAAGSGELAEADDPAVIAADDALMAGDLDEAERAYKKILSERPSDAGAEAGLAQVGLLRRIDGVDPNDALGAASTQPRDVAAQSLAADIEVVSGQAQQAYQRMIELIRQTSGEDREAARRHLVSLFILAAPDDPAVGAARRSLASALY